MCDARVSAMRKSSALSGRPGNRPVITRRPIALGGSLASQWSQASAGGLAVQDGVVEVHRVQYACQRDPEHDQRLGLAGGGQPA